MAISSEIETVPDMLLLNSVQLNIVTTIDVANVVRTNSLEDWAYMMDNSPDSRGKGTHRLETVCKQGQVLNWLLYFLDMKQRPDKSWPMFARIVTIVFLNEEGNSVYVGKVCSDLEYYGGPAQVNSPYTPAYYYWAGTVLPDLEPGLYHYRLVLEFDADAYGTKRLMELSTPSLRVLPADAQQVSGPGFAR